MTQSAAILQIRLEELEKAHAFTALYYTLRAAERLEKWEKAHRELGEITEAEAMSYAAERLYEMADEYRDKSPVSVGDIT